ncbi:MAG: InlB B-repeat-containing protein [Ruminococcus flavefaciens]|nr:InlB B-repeat-containing protein [Ruminococcus flavefaciens]
MKKNISVLIAIIISLVISISCFCVSACSKKIKYKVSYETDGNGTIQGEATQTLESGEQTSTVTATPNEGYQFLRWSDYGTQEMRSDSVTDSDLTYTAYFVKRTYSVSYQATHGGIIEGDTHQMVEYGGDATTVTAKPSIGWGFLKWEDNDSTNPVRTDTDIKSHIGAIALFERQSYGVKTLTYLTDGNGTIEGEVSQRLLVGNNASSVTAVPNEGYEFLQWSDGIKTAERQDLEIVDNITVTAQFKRVYVSYQLDYKLGEADTDITEFTFYDDNFEEVEFPVPTREYFTFGGWYIGNTQVTDINGTMVIGEEILQSEEREIYAKWTANENYTYKILMVYVTELDATLPSVKGNGDFDVHYKMSDFDIEICKTITKQVSYYLNDMLDGLVTFEVDEYFTTVPVGDDGVSKGSVANIILANEIPEIYNSGINKNYQSILTVFCMNDYNYEFRTSAGAAHEKYGTVYLETVYSGCLINKEPLEYLLEFTFWRWHDIIEPFLHELAHTIEMHMYDAYDYHAIIHWAHNQLMYDHILMNKLYYLNMIEIDGKKVGIPIEFWKGELELVPID